MSNLETAMIAFAEAAQNLKKAMDEDYLQCGKKGNAYRYLQFKYSSIISLQGFKPLPKALLDLVWALWLRPQSQVIYEKLTVLPGGKDDDIIA